MKQTKFWALALLLTMSLLAGSSRPATGNFFGKVIFAAAEAGGMSAGYAAF